MTKGLHEQLADHVAATQALAGLCDDIRAVGELLCRTFAEGGVVYALGNGGSAAEAQHLSGELIGHYRANRRPLPAVTLTADPAVMTCIANDYSYEQVFARQVTALVHPRDVVVAFTTSGRSANVVSALAAARAIGATTVLLGGGDGGPALQHADRALLVASAETSRVQELHTLIVHMISELVDEWAAATEQVS